MRIILVCVFFLLGGSCVWAQTNAGNVLVTGNVTIDGTLTVSKAATFSSGASVAKGNLTVAQGNATITLGQMLVLTPGSLKVAGVVVNVP